jgi:hypothetical protein
MNVSSGIRQAALAAAVAFAFAGPALAAEDAHSHAQHAGEVKLTLNHGKKWQTDAPLRQGMNNIRTALASDLKLIHTDKASADQYAALAGKVNGEVASIVQNCKLPPEADAQLHLVVAELLAGADAMQGKDKEATPRAGAERVAKALNQYGQFFEHPGWRKL